ncbi:hypothetical protein H310_14814 [Aphanomyces invadans]|uniref:Uncharacterized protein n=1 Tax=Aphanomyces invadans TaxID=157072 RepID=A0A024T9Z3_9STRA|nr:hypothetical protein H310_14814 [Aphanomyces invadans]ETV90411.1 hypothetical protein H310_14814 [Aphanomyces invadans]|eukprot:XP_008880967.1 hypothetical protein H310_14814 [Aphanomyces invadans]
MKWRRNSGDWLMIGANEDNTCQVAALHQACDLLDLAFSFTDEYIQEYKDAEGIDPTSAISQSKFRPFMRHLVMEHVLPFRLEAATNNIATRKASGVACDAISATDEEGLYLLITTESDVSDACILQRLPGFMFHLYDGKDKVDILDTLHRSEHQRPIQLQRLCRLTPIGIRRGKFAKAKKGLPPPPLPLHMSIAN